MMTFYPPAEVVGVCSAAEHRFCETPQTTTEAHEERNIRPAALPSTTIIHHSRIVVDPVQTSLREVHLLQIELLEELDRRGFELNPGDLGENITTRGVNLLDLGRDTILKIGKDVVLSVIGLSDPCERIERFHPGLMNEMVTKLGSKIVRRGSVMSVAMSTGIISPGDPIEVYRPEGQHFPLDQV